MAEENDRLLYTYSETQAALGGISRTTAWQLVRYGELVCVKIGARAFITAKSIAQYVDRLTAAASA